MQKAGSDNRNKKPTSKRKQRKPAKSADHSLCTTPSAESPSESAPQHTPAGSKKRDSPHDDAKQRPMGKLRSSFLRMVPGSRRKIVAGKTATPTGSGGHSKEKIEQPTCTKTCGKSPSVDAAVGQKAIKQKPKEKTASSAKDKRKENAGCRNCEKANSPKKDSPKKEHVDAPRSDPLTISSKAGDQQKVVDAKMIVHAKDALLDTSLRVGSLHFIGHGVFGNVYKATVYEPGPARVVAVKKIWPQDVDELEGEINIYRLLDHENICKLLYYYKNEVSQQKKQLSAKQKKPSERHKKTQQESSRKKKNSKRAREEERPCWCLVTEFVETSCKDYHERLRSHKKFLDNVTIQKWSYQMWSALAFLHARNIIHRDLKPDNMLLNSSNHTVKLADFGTAKICRPSNEMRNEPYMITRYYRPPEMLLGSTNYGVAVDLWSAACVVAEFWIGEVLLEGDDADHQFELVQLQLGSPTADEVIKMNPEFESSQWRWKTDVKATTEALDKVMPATTDERLLDLLANKLFKYIPSQRVSATDAQHHPYYDDLYDIRDQLGFPLPHNKPQRNKVQPIKSG